MPTVKLSKLQAEEIAYKLTIVRDETDLLESYELTAEEIDELIGAVPPVGGVFQFASKYEDVLVGELENCLEIAQDNLDNGDMSYLSYIRSIRNAINKIKG